MNTDVIRSTLVRAFGVALALASTFASATTFRLTDLGTLEGCCSYGVAINASGQAVVDGGRHVALWDGTMLRDLGTLGGTHSFASAISGTGQVAGFSDTTAGDDFNSRRAFLWDGTTMRDLGTLGGTFSIGYDINDSGQVTGNSDTVDGGSHAFLWDGATLLDLGTLGGSQSEAVAINESGQVTGSAETDEEFVHAFLWDGTMMLDLGTLGGSGSIASAINAAGQVTGWTLVSGDFDQLAFLWDNGVLHDLNDLIDPTDPLSFVRLIEGIDINDRGQILATGLNTRTFEFHAYLVSPLSGDVSEPGTLALLGLGLLGVGVTRRRAN